MMFFSFSSIRDISFLGSADSVSIDVGMFVVVGMSLTRAFSVSTAVLCGFHLIFKLQTFIRFVCHLFVFTYIHVLILVYFIQINFIGPDVCAIGCLVVILRNHLHKH